MALQSALSHLRTSASIQSSDPTESNPDNRAVSAEPTTVSAVSLFDLEDDAFNFSDSDFLNEDPSVSFSVTCKPASLSYCGDRLRCNVQVNNMEARSQNRTAGVTGESMIAPILEAVTKSTVTAAHSVSSNSLEKLKSFTFVGTPNKKGGRRKPEVDSIVVPPAKRTLCGDSTSIRGSDPSCTQRRREPCNMVSQPLPYPPGPVVLKQAMSEFENSSPSNIPPQPKQSSSLGISMPSQDKTDFDFDAFLSELEGNEDSTVVSMASQSTKHPLTYKPSSYNSRRVVAAPKRDGTQSRAHPTPSTRSSCSVGAPTHAATTSNLSRTPLRKGQTPSNVQFRTPVMKNLRPNTVDLTPSTRAAASSSTQIEAFTTPRSREASRRIATPSTVTTPIFKTPFGSRLPMRRKFPGPAGLLPTLTPGQSMESITIPSPSTPVPASTPRVQRIPLPTPQDSICPEPDEFSQGPWLEMLEDLDMSDASSSMLLHYNISSALKQASSKQLQGGKVVHLRVVLKSIVPAGKNASAVLKDPTGEVLCTIHTKVMDDHQKELQPGAVLILRQVSVFSPTPRKHYLNITPDNIVRIYSPNADTGPRQPLLLSQIEKQCTESNTSHCPTMPTVTQWGEDSSTSTGRKSKSEDRFHSVLKSCQHTLATSAQSSLLSQQSMTSHSNQTLSSKPMLFPVLIQNAGTPSVSSASGNQDVNRKTQHSWNDNGGDSFEDWGNFDECFDDELLQEQMQSSGMSRAAGNAPQEQKESAFFNNLCEDEFDSLFTDVADTSFGF